MGGHEIFILCEFEKGTGAREIHRSLDQINKVRSKNSEIFRPKSEIQVVFPAEIGNSSGFSGRNQVISEKKKRSSFQKRHKIRCKSTKNTNLDLDLRSRSPEHVNFFGAQSSLGEAQFSFGGAQAVSWGGTAPVCPPWRQVCGGFQICLNCDIGLNQFSANLTISLAAPSSLHNIFLASAINNTCDETY